RADPSGSRCGRSRRARRLAAIALRLAVPLFIAHLGEPRHRDDALALADTEDDDALGAAARDADIAHRAADHHAAVGHQHDLVVAADREDGDHGIAALPEQHVVDALPAASGDPVVVGGGADAVDLLGDAEDENLVRRNVSI